MAFAFVKQIKQKRVKQQELQKEKQLLISLLWINYLLHFLFAN